MKPVVHNFGPMRRLKKLLDEPRGVIGPSVPLGFFLKRETNSPDYLLKGVFEKGYHYALTGPASAGKTLFVILLTMMVALGGGLFCGRKLKGGRVLYLAGENPPDIGRRFLGMCMTLLNIDKLPIDIISGTEKYRMDNEGDFDRLMDQQEKLGPLELVIIDTKTAYFAAAYTSENDGNDQQQYAEKARRLTTLPGRPCVIDVCHTNAAGAVEPRGARTYYGAIDGNAQCIGDEDTVRIERTVKWRGDNWDPMVFKVVGGIHTGISDSDDDPIFTVMAQEMTDQEFTKVRANARALDDRILLAMDANPEASVADIAEACDVRLKNGMPHKTKIVRRYAQLMKSGLVRQDGDGNYKLTKKGRSETEAKRAKNSGTATSAI